MGKTSSLKTIYIDAASFAQPRKSGIGYVAEGIAVAIKERITSGKLRGYRLVLVVSLGKAKYLRGIENEYVAIKTMPLPYRVIQLLNKLNLLPPVDIFLGKGIYIFPNYRNWKLLFSKSLTYIHDLTYLHFPEYTEPKNLVYLAKSIPRWIKRTNIVVTGSNYTRNELIKYLNINPKRVVTVYHGIDKKVFSQKNTREITATLGKYGIEKSNFILHVGNIEPRKNIVGLLNAYSLLSETEKNAHPLLLIGGGGWSNTKEEEIINELLAKGAVILRPNQYVEDGDLPAFYSAASVLAMPSFYEGFGLPPLQAAACNTPIVVSNNSSLEEIFKDTAFMVDPNSIKAIAEGLSKALNLTNTDRILYENKVKRLVASYSWSNTVDRLVKIIEKIND